MFHFLFERATVETWSGFNVLIVELIEGVESFRSSTLSEKVKVLFLF